MFWVLPILLYIILFLGESFFAAVHPVCKKRSTQFFYCCVLIVSAICFLMLYGIMPLNVADDRWIAPGYVEYDINQHYAGWLAARNSKWSFPLGYTDTINYPDGAIISFTDSIPLVSILFKLFSAVLPETFQFFGIFILACFLLQGISSAMLLCLFVKDRRMIIISILLFLYCPVMVERAFRHCGLAAHFLILFALYFYFRSKKETHRLSKWYWLLGVLAISIHPYFLPMVMGIYAADAVSIMIEKKMILKPIVHFMLGIIITALTGVIIGALGFSTGEGGGYGHAALNLNGIWNPVSLPDLHWSAFLKALPYAQTWWPWDGFNYWGAGLLLFSGLFLVEMIFKRFIHSQVFFRCLKNKARDNKNFCIKYPELYILFLGFLVFAVSNMIYFNDRLVFEYQLPDIPLWENICEIFRASGRMLWPVTYTVLTGIIGWLSEKRNRNVWIILLASIQLLDLSPALTTKKNEWNEENIAKKYADTIFADDSWTYLGEHIDYLWVMGNMGYSITMYTQKYHMITNIGSMNREILIHKEGTDYRNELFSGKKIERNTAYLFPKENLEDVMCASLVMDENLHVYDMGDSYVVWAGELLGRAETERKMLCCYR